jgi:beta-lactamase class A
MTQLYKYLIAVLVLIVVILSGCVVYDVRKELHFESFVNPALKYVRNESLSLGTRLALQEEVRTYAEEAVHAGTLSGYAVYYRELISGPVIALNQDVRFAPASLLKLPIAMWYFKHAEEDPKLLEEKLKFTGPRGESRVYFLPTRVLEEGHIYTVRELIDLMLAESDNDATKILIEYAGGRERINEVYQELGIKDVENYDTYFIDVQTYTSFFRVLYNMEYLSEEYSNEILEMLTHASFSSGITTGVSAATPVAHKFGERDLAEDLRQLHDCGIVYKPENPYLLCVMTQGKDYDAMASFIAAIAHKVNQAPLD